MMQHFNADFKNKEIYPFPFYLSIDNKEMTFRPIGTLTHSVTGKNLISIRRKLKEDTEYLLSGNSEDEPTIEVYKYRGK